MCMKLFAMHRLYSILGLAFLMMIASSKVHCQTRVLDDLWIDELREGLDGENSDGYNDGLGSKRFRRPVCSA